MPFPSPNASPEAQGIHQSDLVLRSALLAGLADLRANPYLLDWVFAGLRSDPTTKAEYRERQIQEAKNWFLNTKVPVLMYPRQDQIEFPCITIALRQSEEVDREATTADTHYTTEEDLENYWPSLAGPFAPTSYNMTTGVLGVPAALQQPIAAGMIVLDANGREFQVLAGSAGSTIQIVANADGDFSKVVLKPPHNNDSASLESASFREVYSVGCHAEGESVYLTYLHSIVVFLFLRYREELLEARGFERSSIGSDEFIPDAQYLEGKENVFSRYIRVSGNVRQYWPKYMQTKVLTVSATLSVIGAGKTPPTMGKPQDNLWKGDGDAIG